MPTIREMSDEHLVTLAAVKAEAEVCTPVAPVVLTQALVAICAMLELLDARLDAIEGS